MFFGLAAVITIIPDPHYFVFSSALTDLSNGSAKAYGDALHERMEIYNSGEKNITVSPLPSQPELLYFSDIKEDPEDWEKQRGQQVLRTGIRKKWLQRSKRPKENALSYLTLGKAQNK